MTGTDLSPTGLRLLVADLIGHDTADVADDADLFAMGLDSIGLMRLVNGWRRAGLEVTFADLAADPTLAAWDRLLVSASTVDEPIDHEPAPGGDRFPLATMQHAYWAGQGDEALLGGVAAHLFCEFDLPAPGLDPDRLRTAFDLLLARHDMLRMQVSADGQQWVNPDARWRGLQVHDLRSDAAAVDEHLARVRERFSHQRLAIADGEVLAAALTLLPDGSSRLHLDVDMIAGDAMSYRTLTAELARFCATGRDDLDPIGYSFQDYCRDRPVARAAAAERAATYWDRRLDDLPEPPRLPSTPHPPTGAPRVTRRFLVLDDTEYGALAAAAASRGLTAAAVFATVFAEVIGHWSAQHRFLLNVPLFDRAPTHPHVERVVGDFSSSVLLAVDLDPGADLTTSARSVQRRLHADAGYADQPGVQVLRDLTRRRRRPVLAPVVFTSALSLGDLFSSDVRTALGDPVWMISQGPQVLLDAQVTELAGGILVNWDSRESEFPDGVLDAMFAGFTHLLRGLTGAPGTWDVAASDLLPEVGAPSRRLGSTATTEPGRAPAPVHDVVAIVWCDALDVTDLDPDTDYFALGGDSVLATTIVRDLREAFDTDAVTIGSLLAAPTVRTMAARIAADAADPARLLAAAEIYLEVAALSDDEVSGALDGAQR